MGLFKVISSMMLIIAGCHGLICYETNVEDGKVEANNCTSCTYCVISVKNLNPQMPGALFGVGPENDQTELYDEMFETRHDKEMSWAGGQSVNMYQILSGCLLERYYDPWAPTSSAYMFRCFCNYDRCNKGSKLKTFLHNLKTDYDTAFTGFLDTLSQET